MGEAKKRRLAGTGKVIVYHHTSTLRTNLIWMSGVIDLEGLSPPVLHPHTGEIGNDALARREYQAARCAVSVARDLSCVCSS